ncbi:MAG: alkaline phosphatase D family protein [Maricaulaceae bacterium]
MLHKKISRRTLLGSAGVAGLAACAPKDAARLSSERPASRGLFAHGIASGDPLSNAVILWTRITPENPNAGPVEILWEMSETDNFETLAANGTGTAQAASNWTFKVDAQNLTAGTTYYYRFTAGETSSPTGVTNTLPEGALDKARFAVVSCSNWQHGYFNAYDHIARQDHFDAVLHLGDYYYEYAAEDYADPKMLDVGRVHEPRHEIISLEDYRIRHAQYRTDPSLQAMTAKLPLITIWDDHETSNDSWKGGAENHGNNEGEGSWDSRKQAAMRAYYEWMPIRDPQAGKARETLFRHIEYGDLLSLITVETRLNARAEPLIIENYVDEITAPGGDEKFKAEILGDPKREMYGQVQEDFIVDELSRSKEDGKAWRILANQVIMGRLSTADLTPHVNEDAVQAIEKNWAGIRDFITLSKYSVPVYPDSWDGYPHARDHFYDRLVENDVRDIMVLTGDAHEFWANHLTAKDGKQIGVEFVTSSVSSETLTAYLGDGTADYALLLTQSNEDARYYNPLHNGYNDITFTRRNATVRMIGISDVSTRTYSAFDVASFVVKPNKGSLSIGSPKGLNLKQRALFSGLG